MRNVILRTDSYKLGHWTQYPKNTEGVYSYFESRQGAEYPETVFFGLQPILRSLTGYVVDRHDVEDAATLSRAHFGTRDLFNYNGWMHIVREHGGHLPVRIKAVPEGTPVPTGNVLMTVENTDPACFWLTNALESLLTHVWYPSTVASKSRAVKKMLAGKLRYAGAPLDGLDFMLHDFGYRGVTSDEAAEFGGAAHLVNFLGTDTLLGMTFAMEEYRANLETLAFSVPATEHSVMTALGREGESKIVDQLLTSHPTGILSVVADSYNIYDFVSQILPYYYSPIMQREGKFVVRPDSVTQQHPNPGLLVVDLLERLWKQFGGTTNQKGYRTLDPHIGMLWGDGLDEEAIEKIVNRAMFAGFSPENLVFGMGGGLLQKLNRDTQRFAFKSSAQKRDGVWHDVFKSPLDASKASKKGRLRLAVDTLGNFETTDLGSASHDHEVERDALVTVFEDGELFNETTFDEVRKRAAL